MPYYWEYPKLLTQAEQSSSEETEESTATTSITQGVQDDSDNMTLEIRVTSTEKPEKNMQPFRETVSEFEMFTRAGKYSMCLTLGDLRAIYLDCVFLVEGKVSFRPKAKGSSRKLPKYFLMVSN